METKQIFAKRLRAAREIKSMSLEELSDAIDNIVTSQALSKYENGAMLPSSTVIIKLSKALDRSVDYFVRPFEVEMSGIEFRKKSKLSVKARRSIEGVALDYVEKYVELNDICGIERPSINDLKVEVHNDTEIIKYAENLRESFGYNKLSIPDVIDFLETMGVFVVEISASEQFDGLSGFANDIPVVVLNKGFIAERKRFTALHELGHLLMSFDSQMSEHDIELSCNLFASEMLIPFDVFEKKIADVSVKPITLRELAAIQKEYGISIDALMYKAAKNTLIPQRKQRNYHILKNSRPEFKKYAEQSRTPPESADLFESLTYRAYSMGLISLGKAAYLLDTNPERVLQQSLVL